MFYEGKSYVGFAETFSANPNYGYSKNSFTISGILCSGIRYKRITTPHGMFKEPEEGYI